MESTSTRSVMRLDEKWQTFYESNSSPERIIVASGYRVSENQTESYIFLTTVFQEKNSGGPLISSSSMVTLSKQCLLH